MPLLNIFTNNLLPILLISGAGFLLGKFLHVESRPLGQVIFYILSPLLIFNLLTQSALSLDKVALTAGFCVVVTLVSGGLALLLGWVFRLERASLTVVVLTCLFGNNGNFGLPLISFAFGKDALAYASIYFVTSSIMFYTLGVTIASLGHLRLKEALLGLLKVPAIYAIILALIFIRTGWTLPIPIQRTVSLAADAAVPGMLVLLGLELQRSEWTKKLRALGLATTIRLVIGPVIGLVIAALFGMKDVSRKTGIVNASLPAAVMTTVIANEYKLDSTLVTAIIFVSTILSPLTLTMLLYFLGK
jgi:malate permease and related proteins